MSVVALFSTSTHPLPSNTPIIIFSCNSNSSRTPNVNTSISSFKSHFPIHKKPRNNQNPSSTNFKNNNNGNRTLNSPIQSEPLKSNDGGAVKLMPTAPWMTSPLLISTDEVLDLSKISSKERSSDGDVKKTDGSLTDSVRGGRGKQAMLKIVESITKLQELQMNSDKPLKKGAEKEEEVEFEVPLDGVCEGSSNSSSSSKEVRMPWTKARRLVFPRTKKEKVVTAAELNLPEVLLKRLRNDAVKITKWVKVKKAGVTQAKVDEIEMIWRGNELAMVKFEFPLCRDMDRAREVVEYKTGGLVVWSKKDTHVVYRGLHHKAPTSITTKLNSGHASDEVTEPILHNPGDGKINSLFSGMAEHVGLQPVRGTLYERETDRLLDALGPRFIDWWWRAPLPIDGDLLAEVVPGFRPPFRLCPPRVRRQLADDELTYLRKLARRLPTHFALGRNTKLQGLAAAIVKLWETSLIVKIAIKWGVPNTNNEKMAWEIKRLTGGVLILRNKFFIIFYRGKDFISPRVTSLIANREKELKRCQLQEEGARWKATESFHIADETVTNLSTTGTISEFQDIQTKYEPVTNGYGNYDVQVEAEKHKLEKELRIQRHKLSLLEVKMEKSVKELSKLLSASQLTEMVMDREMITQEERQCFRRMGLQMDRELVLGRRGVFDGIVESIHQHWKHREVAKVITMQRSYSQVLETARVIEIESGGILVMVEKLQKGHAIILYRGKNYRRPLKLLSGNLLTKREALHKSLEKQRLGSLKFFASQRQQKILELESKLRDLQKDEMKPTPGD